MTKKFAFELPFRSPRFCKLFGTPTAAEIDLNDVLMIYNDANVFGSGYLATDVTGNSIVDLNDILIAYNNSTGFVSVTSP